MARYLFIESRDPWDDLGASAYLGYALELARRQEPVTVYFVENGVNAARQGARVPLRDALREAGAALHADAFALREHGIAGDGGLSAGVAVGGVEHLADLLADPETKAVWH